MRVRAFRQLPLALALALTVTFGVGQLPGLQSPAAAATGDAADTAAVQLRTDQCLLSDVLRLGGPAAKQVARTGLAGNAAATHTAANPDYWEATPLSTAYDTDHSAQLAKLDQLLTVNENLTNVNGNLSLGTLETPQAWPYGPADPWDRNTPTVDDPFQKLGFSSWVAQNFWTDHDSFYVDRTPLASAESVAALTALGARYQYPEGTDPNFHQDSQEYQAWRNMTFMHGYYADDTRIVLENGGFPRTAPAPGTLEFRVAVEQLKARFSGCASADPEDPNQVLNPEVVQAGQEWQAEINGQKAQRDAIYSASATTEAALAAGTEALGHVVEAAEQANLLTYWTGYWKAPGPGVVGNGPILFKLSSATSLCLDNKNGATADNNPIQAVACTANNTGQQWKGYDGPKLDNGLRNPTTGKCLKAAGTTTGSKVVLFACNGSAAEHWQYVTTKGVTRLYNVGAKLCLGFPTATSGTAATVRTCDAGTSQNFAASQDNTATNDGDKYMFYPTAAEFSSVSQALTTLRATANTQNQIVAAQAAIAKAQAAAVTTAQSQAYAIADAAGAPRGRGLLSGSQEAQVVLASSAALTALVNAGDTAYHATSASVADSQTLTAAAQTQALSSQAAFKLAAAQEADNQAKAAASGAAQQAKNAAAQAGIAKQALATAQTAEARAKKDADTAHTKRLAAEAEQQTAAKKKAEAAQHEAQAAKSQAAAEKADQAAQGQLSKAQSAKTTAQRRAADAQQADQDATTARQQAWDAQSRKNALQAQAYAADAHADAAAAGDDAHQSRDAANTADAAADAADADATEAQQHADAASAAAAAADAAATEAEAAATRAQSDADAAAAAKADADQALRENEAAAAVALKAAQQASADAVTAQQDAAKAQADAQVSQQDANDSAVAAQQAQAQAAVTAGYAYTTAQAATAATAAAQQVTDPANDAIQLGAPYVDRDSSAGLAVLSAQAAKTIAEQQAAAAQAKARQAAQVATSAQELADTATGDAKAAAVVAADAAVQAAHAAVSAQQALASAVEAQKYAAQAKASVAQTKAYVAQATADSAAAQAAATSATADAADARASANQAEQDAAAAQQAASDARSAAAAARQAAQEADAAAAAAEAAAEDAQAQAESAQRAATLAEQQANSGTVQSGGATGVAGVYTTQKITPVGDPVPLGPCEAGPFERYCQVTVRFTFNLTVDFYLCDDATAKADLNAGGCPADRSTFLGSQSRQTQSDILETIDVLKFSLHFDEALVKALWTGFTGDFVKCSHGSASGCAWAASWFIPGSWITKAVDGVKALNIALHTGIGIEDAWKVVDGLKLSPEIADALHAEVDAEEAALAGCELNSFLPGTQVLRADGSYVAATAVRVGDRVLGVDSVTGKQFDSPVTATFAHTTRRALRTFTLTGGDVLTTTPGHLIYAIGRGWELASDLRVGDRVDTAGGTGRTITSIGSAPGAGRLVVDFTVAGTHDFYVRAGAADVLVHNCSNLAVDEGINGAHTLADHVNITAADAVAKATASTPTGVWSSQALAQQAVDTAVERYAKSNAKTIEAWFKRYGKNPTLENSTLELPLQKLPSEASLGKVYYSNGRTADAGNTYKVVLKRVAKHPQGFVVYTSFPLP